VFTSTTRPNDILGSQSHPTLAFAAATIEYRHNFPLDPAEVVRVFESSGITRPTSDHPRIARMFASSNLVISARANGVLVSVCRAPTDYSYCCYLSDLAVDRAFQQHGIGKQLIKRVQAAIGEEVALILLLAPGAMSYYPHVGFAKAENAFIIKRAK
jgi:GNAT superfamily N-acetyltransferase